MSSPNSFLPQIEKKTSATSVWAIWIGVHVLTGQHFMIKVETLRTYDRAQPGIVDGRKTSSFGICPLASILNSPSSDPLASFPLHRAGKAGLGFP